MGQLAVIENTTPTGNAELWKASTNAAGLCKQIVLERAINLQGKKYVPVEGWQAIALAHGCVASAENVRHVEGGIAADGVIRRMSDGGEVARAEGFVGEDEPVWYGGTTGSGKVLPKRPDFAIRAMAQTRGISRACRSAFAHVVVMMAVGLETTPYEEMQGVADYRADHNDTIRNAKPADPSGHEQARAKAEAWTDTHKAEVTAAADFAALDAVIAKGKGAVAKLDRDHRDLRDAVMDAYSAKGEALEAAVAAAAADIAQPGDATDGDFATDE